MTLRGSRVRIAIAAMLLATSLVRAADPIKFEYVYDELGQLIKVIDSTGITLEYIYDVVGNTKEIKRTISGELAIYDFAPKQGPIGTRVTLRGRGFSPNPLTDIVAFSGTSATVVSATTEILVVAVPPGTTNGPISVSVDSASAVTDGPFTVTVPPILTSVSPRVIPADVGNTTVNVQGANLAGATFSVSPAIVPAGLAITSATAAHDGKSATLQVTTGATHSQFVLVAATPFGTSSNLPNPGANTISVIGSNRDEVDDDGDGFPTGLELALGSDPFDPASLPVVPSSGEAVSAVFSLLNQVNPDPGSLSIEAISPVISILNTANPAATNLPGEAVSPTFSIKNTPP